MSQSSLPCWIYKSPRKDEMYLYLAAEDGFGAVPPALIERFGTPRLVIRLDLHPDRSLALEDMASAMANLQGQGHHLQLPPDIRPDLYVVDWQRCRGSAPLPPEYRSGFLIAGGRDAHSALKARIPLLATNQ